MIINTNLKYVGVLLLFQCLQLGISLPQGFFSGISPFSSRRTNDNSGNLPFNIKLKSPISGLFGRQKNKQNQYPIQSDYNKGNYYDYTKTSNGYREEAENEEKIEYQAKNEEQNKVEVLQRTSAFDAFNNEQRNIEQDNKLQTDPNYDEQIEEAKDPSDSAANEIDFDKTTETTDDIETTTSTDDYETTTDDYDGIIDVRILNSNVVASLLG